MEAHPGAVKTYPGAGDTHPGLWSHGDVEAQPRAAVEAQPRDMKAHPSVLATFFVHVSIVATSPDGLRMLGNVQLSRVRRILCSSHP